MLAYIPAIISVLNLAVAGMAGWFAMSNHKQAAEARAELAILRADIADQRRIDSESIHADIGTVASEVISLRTEMANQRRKDADEMRGWINGSFMRAKEVAARLDADERRIGTIERHIGQGLG